ENYAIRNIATCLLPQRLVLVALTERLALDECPIGTHARHGIDIVALGFADQRIEYRAGEMALTHQALQAGNQRIFVSAVQGVARLESDDAFPALFGEQRSRLARRQDELAVFGVLRLRQDAHRAAQQMRPRIALGHPAAGMIETLGAVNTANIVGL